MNDFVERFRLAPYWEKEELLTKLLKSAYRSRINVKELAEKVSDEHFYR